MAAARSSPARANIGDPAHSGCLPLLAKNGYEGPIYATPATRDLCAVMLEDAAMIQKADARYVNKRIDRESSRRP